jgi:hypothetical protein
MKISEVSLPAESALRHALQRIDYCDSYETQLIKSDLSVNEAYLAIFEVTPGWVRCLMFIRGEVVALFGLTHLKHSDSRDFTIGKRVASFKVQAIYPNELIVGDDYKYFNYIILTIKSFWYSNTFITVSTAVEIHNRLGHLYMFLVKPFHRFIAPYMMKVAVLEDLL